jgi:hypothetical protein
VRVAHLSRLLCQDQAPEVHPGQTRLLLARHDPRPVRLPIFFGRQQHPRFRQPARIRNLGRRLRNLVVRQVPLHLLGLPLRESELVRVLEARVLRTQPRHVGVQGPVFRSVCGAGQAGVQDLLQDPETRPRQHGGSLRLHPRPRGQGLLRTARPGEEEESSW